MLITIVFHIFYFKKCIFKAKIFLKLISPRQLWRVKKVQLTGNNFTQKGLHDLTRRLGDVEDKKVIDLGLDQTFNIECDWLTTLDSFD